MAQLHGSPRSSSSPSPHARRWRTQAGPRLPAGSHADLVKAAPYYDIYMVSMVRWILGSEWVLDITIHDECCGDDKVDTRPRVGASYYHLIYWNAFLYDLVSLSLFFLFFFFFLNMSYPFFPFFSPRLSLSPLFF
jgi:hypothetical protein